MDIFKKIEKGIYVFTNTLGILAPFWFDTPPLVAAI